MNSLIPVSTDASIPALILEVYFLSLLFRTRLQEYREYKRWWARGDVTIGVQKLFKVISKKASSNIKKIEHLLKYVMSNYLQKEQERLFFSEWINMLANKLTHTQSLGFPEQWSSFLCYLLVSPISYSLSLSSSKMSTSSLPVVERLLLLLMLSLASVIARRSPLLHSIGSSRMAAEENGK